MSDYHPDCWVVIKIGEGNLYKVFACWYGGYLGSDSWRLNSGITRVTVNDNVFSFEGSSGSVYHCHKDNYRTSGFGAGVLQNLITQAKESRDCVIMILDEKTDWMKLTYE